MGQQRTVLAALLWPPVLGLVGGAELVLPCCVFIARKVCIIHMLRLMLIVSLFPDFLLPTGCESSCLQGAWVKRPSLSCSFSRHSYGHVEALNVRWYARIFKVFSVVKCLSFYFVAKIKPRCLNCSGCEERFFI